MDHSWSTVAAGFAVAFLVGVSKTGVPGIGILVVPLMAMLFPARTSVGALLPLLCLADVVATAMYRRHAQWPLLWRLLPWTAAGMALAALALGRIPDRFMAPALGLLVLGLLALELARQRSGLKHLPHTAWFTSLAGALTGFATTIGNLAGPVVNIFLIGKGFDKKEFIGTVAWYFLIINAVKLPIFWSLGMITAETLRFDLVAAPGILVGGAIGRLLLHAIPERLFQALVMILAAVAALRMLM
jgi:uncharacterized protein